MILEPTWLPNVSSHQVALARMPKGRRRVTHGSQGAEIGVPLSKCAQDANTIKYKSSLSSHRLQVLHFDRSFNSLAPTKSCSHRIAHFHQPHWHSAIVFWPEYQRLAAVEHVRAQAVQTDESADAQVL